MSLIKVIMFDYNWYCIHYCVYVHITCWPWYPIYSTLYVTVSFPVLSFKTRTVSVINNQHILLNHGKRKVKITLLSFNIQCTFFSFLKLIQELRVMKPSQTVSCCEFEIWPGYWVLFKDENNTLWFVHYNSYHHTVRIHYSSSGLQWILFQHWIMVIIWAHKEAHVCREQSKGVDSTSYYFLTHSPITFLHIHPSSIPCLSLQWKKWYRQCKKFWKCKNYIQRM